MYVLGVTNTSVGKKSAQNTNVTHHISAQRTATGPARRRRHRQTSVVSPGQRTERRPQSQRGHWWLVQALKRLSLARGHPAGSLSPPQRLPARRLGGAGAGRSRAHASSATSSSRTRSPPTRGASASEALSPASATPSPARARTSSASSSAALSGTVTSGRATAAATSHRPVAPPSAPPRAATVRPPGLAYTG